MQTPSFPRGVLSVVGTGVKSGTQITQEVVDRIRSADVVFHLMVDEPSRAAIRRLNHTEESLHGLFGSTERRVAYEAMAARILAAVESGRRVCAAFYGHPTLFAKPSRLAVEHARRNGHRCDVLPGVSSVDSLLADLLLDPGETGCVIVEAERFVERPIPVSSASLLIILQPGLIGEAYASVSRPTGRGMDRLSERLHSTHRPDHTCILYEAATSALAAPKITSFVLADLCEVKPAAHETLVLPPDGKHFEVQTFAPVATKMDLILAGAAAGAQK